MAVPYVPITTLRFKFGDEKTIEVPGRIRRFAVQHAAESVEGELELESTLLVSKEASTEFFEAVDASIRKTQLVEEIRAAECELFASMLRYWTFL